MSEKSKHNEQLEEIFKYLNDSMTNSERYEFERELERDTFSYEAFDGLSGLKSTEIEKDLWSLDVIAGKKKKSNKIIVWLSVAAGVVVLVSLSFLLYENFDQFDLKFAKGVKETPPEEINEPLTFKKESVRTLPSDTTSIMLAEAGLNKKESSAGEVPGSKVVSPDGKVASVKIKGTPDVNKKKAIQQGTGGEAMSVTMSVIVEDENLKSESVTETPVIEASAENAESKYTEEETAQKEEALKRPGVSAEPEPFGGNALYRQYIESNVKYPANIEDQQRVTIKVSFKISKTGIPTKIRVDKSPGEEYTREAIRLIENGPRWSPKIQDGIPVEGDMSIRVTFKPQK